MLTKLEQNTIKSMLNRKLNTDLTAVSADRTIMKINRGVNKILEFYLEDYRIKSKDSKIGKSAYLHILLHQFAKDQPALIRFGEFDSAVLNGSSMLKALQEFKKMVRTYVDSGITSQSETVLALLIYSSTRAYEVKNDMKITDYLDDEYEADMEEQLLPPVIPVTPCDISLEDLFESNKDLCLIPPVGRTP